MNDPVISVNVDAKLALNKYNVDEGHAHIALSDDADRAEFRKLVLACPAALYKIDEDGGLSFDYAGCLECGTCASCAAEPSSSDGSTPSPPWAWNIGTGEDAPCRHAGQHAGRHGGAITLTSFLFV